MQTEEMVAAAIDEEYDEAFAVFPVSTDPGSDDIYLKKEKHPKYYTPIMYKCTFNIQLATKLFTCHQLQKINCKYYCC